MLNNTQNTSTATINLIDALAANGALDAVRRGVVSAKHPVHLKRRNYSSEWRGRGGKCLEPAGCCPMQSQRQQPGFSTSFLAMSGPTGGSLTAAWATTVIGGRALGA